MNTNLYRLSLTVLTGLTALFNCSCERAADGISVYQVDPLKKVLKEQSYFEDSDDTLAVAKGETASFQLVFRSIYPVEDLEIEAEPLSLHDSGSNSHFSSSGRGEVSIPASMTAFVGYVHVPDKFLAGNPSDQQIKTVSGYYPDPLWEKESMDVPSMSNQPVWINYSIPRDAGAGVYGAKIWLKGKAGGKRFRVGHEVAAKVYNVALPEQTLFIDNWINPYPQELGRMNNGEIFPLYSDRYWELNKVIANKMRDYGQNVYRLFPLQQGNWCIDGRKEDGQLRYDFNFRHFDRSVEMYMREGGLKRIAGYHLGQRIEPGWYSDIGVYVPLIEGKDTVTRVMPVEAPEAMNFLDQFIPALDAHLKEKGWSDIYWQYLADEPADGEYVDSYLKTEAYIKKLAPDLKIMDALHRTPAIAKKIELPVCILDRFHLQYDELYKPMIDSGKEVWFYTCMEPLGNYANRFIEQPLIQTRILHWINYRYGAKGYLCWGLNSWRNDDVGGEDIDWGNVPAGDCWIIYPDFGKVHGSIRLEAMRDGINDYELLRLLEKIRPEKARQFAAETVVDFDSYDNDINDFRRRRVQMLELLEEKPRLRREDSFLGVHFDFHAGPDCKEVGRNVSPEMVNAIIDKVHPDFMQIDCKGHGGYSSYPTEVGNPAPGFVCDPMQIWRDVTKSRGVSLFVHYSGVWDFRAVELHPEWAVMDGEGRRSKKITSVYGPYVDSLMIPQLKELAGKYGMDGAWVDGECWGTAPDYSPGTVESFKKATGADAVPQTPSDPYWYEWKEFHREAFRKYLRHYTEEMHKSYPDFQLCSNWAFTHHMSEPVSADVDFLSGDYAPQNSVNSARIAGRYLANQGLPWDLMAWSFAFDNGPIGQKPAVQLKREAAVTMALGGGIQMYFLQNRDGSVRLDELDAMSEVAGFVRERQAFCQHSTQIPQVALLLSTADFRHYDHPEDSLWLYPNYTGKAAGVLQCLLENQYSVDVAGEAVLSENAGRFPLVVVPECEYLEPEFCSTLLEYAKTGGSLLVIGEKSTARFSELANVSCSHVSDSDICFGKGKIGFMPHDFSEEYESVHSENLRERLATTVDVLFPEPAVRVGGSPFVDVSLRSLGANTYIHLVNTSGDHRHADFIHGIDPVGPLSVSVACPSRPSEIRLRPSGKPLDFEYRDGKATFGLEELDIYDIVEITMQ